MRFAIFLLLAAFLAVPAHAGLIRDAETEHVLREMADPVFAAAGMEPSSVNLFIVDNNTINAYVAGGSNIFIHTGLILACERPEMVIGVLAHETGHITGGHLARGAEQLKSASIGAILSYVLGAAAAVSGAGDVGAAVISAGTEAATRNFLSFTRANEQAADQAALGYLDHMGLSAQGMLDTFKLLRRNEKQQFGRIDPYIRTHPLSGERIEHIRNHIAEAALNDSASPAISAAYQRILGKLEGFLQSPDNVFMRYPMGANTARGLYARSVALYREGKTDEALTTLDRLDKLVGQDGYLLDMRGQILFEAGRIAEAEAIYAEAAKLVPSSALIRTSYAQTLMASENAAKTNRAVTELEFASTKDPTYQLTWHLLATAYGKVGKNGQAQLALAEEAFLNHKLKDARHYSKLALDSLEKGTPSHQRAADLLETVKSEIREEKKQNDSILPLVTTIQ